MVAGALPSKKSIFSMRTKERLEKEWHIESETEPISLLKAPRAVRIVAADMLSRLIDELKEAAERGVKATEKAKEIADKL